MLFHELGVKPRTWIQRVAVISLIAIAFLVPYWGLARAMRVEELHLLLADNVNGLILGTIVGGTALLARKDRGWRVSKARPKRGPSLVWPKGAKFLQVHDDWRVGAILIAGSVWFMSWVFDFGVFGFMLGAGLLLLTLSFRPRWALSDREIFHRRFWGPPKRLGWGSLQALKPMHDHRARFSGIKVSFRGTGSLVVTSWMTWRAPEVLEMLLAKARARHIKISPEVAAMGRLEMKGGVALPLLSFSAAVAFFVMGLWNLSQVWPFLGAKSIQVQLSKAEVHWVRSGRSGHYQWNLEWPSLEHASVSVAKSFSGFYAENWRSGQMAELLVASSNSQHTMLRREWGRRWLWAVTGLLLSYLLLSLLWKSQLFVRY